MLRVVPVEEIKTVAAPLVGLVSPTTEGVVFITPTPEMVIAPPAPSTLVPPPGPPVAVGAVVAPVAVATGGTAGRGRRRRRVGVGATGARAVSTAATVAVAPVEKAAEALRLAAEAERAAAVLRRADQTHTLHIEWSRSLDNKVAPLLTVAGAISAVVLFLLNHATLLVNHDLTRNLLFATFMPLFAVLVKCMVTISPSLKLARWGQNRHKPDATKAPTSHIFFGQIARYGDKAPQVSMRKKIARLFRDDKTDLPPLGGMDGFIREAKAHYADPDRVLDDLLAQTYINARVATEKAADITFAVRWLFGAIFVLAVAACVFLAGW